jgi:hypothetical protein
MAKKNAKKHSGPAKIDPRLVYLDAEALNRARTLAGMSERKLSEEADIAWNTLLKAFRGDGVAPQIAAKLSEAVACELDSLLAPWDPRYRPSVARVDWEWEVDAHLEPGRCASNGLHFFVCRMRHRHTTGRLGRGKCYHLSGLSASARQEKRKYLLRHAKVTHEVGTHPNLAETVAVTPVADEAAWWLVDKWIAGPTLAQQLRQGPLPKTQLAKLARGILLGLEALHGKRIVMRELAPQRIIVAEEDGRAVLTDFELAKLLDDAPSGWSDWPDDAYRAPEVETGQVDARADLYSWARILLEAGLGELPEIETEEAALESLRLPQSVARVVRQSLSGSVSGRPESAREVLRSISAWQ